MNVKRILSVGCLMLLTLSAAPLLGQATLPPEKLVAIIKSDAPLDEKADACRQLAIVGTKDAVEPLSKLLADEKLSHPARYAMETLNDPSVDDAFRAALGQLKGRQLVGVIGSIGIRKDTKAIDALAKLLTDADEYVAQAAARSLGKIGTPEAAKVLDGALATASAGNQLNVVEGLLRAAETMLAAGQKEPAIAIYDKLRGHGAHQVRAGATRGAILARGQEGMKLFAECLKNADYIVFAAAAGAAIESREAQITGILAGELAKLDADRQVVVLGVLARLQDVATMESIAPLFKSPSKPVRIAAVRATAAIGSQRATALLLDGMCDTDKDVSSAAQEALASVPGAFVDKIVTKMLESKETDARLIALDLIARRRMTDCMATVLKATSDPDPKIRPAAIRKVGELATVNELPGLLELFSKAEGADLDAAEQAVTMVCNKADKPETCVEKIAPMLASAQGPRKAAILKVLSGIGGAEALKSIRWALSDNDAAVRAAAIRALGSWKNADAAPDLLKIAQTAEKPNEKILGLRAYLSLAGRSDLDPQQRLELCREGAKLVQRPEEKRMLLGALGGIQRPPAAAMIALYLDDAAVKEEAATALVNMSEKMLKSANPKVAATLAESLTKASTATANEGLAKRAKTLANQYKAKAGAK